MLHSFLISIFQSRLGLLQLLYGGRRGHAQLLHEDYHRAPSQAEAPSGGSESRHSRSRLWRGCSRRWALLCQRPAAVSGWHDRRGVGPEWQCGRSGKWGRTNAGFGGRLWAGGVWGLREGDGRDGSGNGPSWFTLLEDRLYPSTERAEKLRERKDTVAMLEEDQCEQTEPDFLFLRFNFLMKLGLSSCTWRRMNSIHIRLWGLQRMTCMFSGYFSVPHGRKVDVSVCKWLYMFI